MSIRRPLCVACIIVLIGAFIISGGSPPEPSWDVDGCKGRTVCVRGTVENRQVKNGIFQIFLKDVTFITDGHPVKGRADFPQGSQGITVEIQDAKAASDYSKIGAKIEAKGVFEPYDLPRCEGQFDARSYYMIQGYDGRLKRARITGAGKDYAVIREWLRGLRDRAVDILNENMDEKDAGLVAAMTLGDRAAVDAKIKETYQLAGISHVLALSGLHIASVGLALLTLLRKFGLSARMSAFISGTVISVYAVMTGLSTSTVRAVIMFGLSVISILIGRSYDLMSAAAASAVIMVIYDRYYVFDTGFLLSFGAVAGIALIYPILSCAPGMFRRIRDGEEERKSIASRIKDRIRSLYDPVCVSVSVMIATLPVMGYGFMQISVLSVVINLAVIPLMGLVLMTGFSGIILGFLGLKPADILQITHYILSFYEAVGETSAKIRGNTLVIGKPREWQIITYAIIVISAVVMGNAAKLNNTGGTKAVNRTGRQKSLYNGSDRKTGSNKITYAIQNAHVIAANKVRKRIMMLGSIGLMGGACVILSIHPREELEIRNVDVGQGDCALIWGDDIPNIMIDGGSTDVKQVGKYRITPVLKANRVTSVDYCFLTHMDSDHVNGVLEILEDDTSPIVIRKVIISAASYAADPENENMVRLMQAAKRKRTSIMLISAGDLINAGDIKITCLSPKKEPAPGFDPNDSSVVLRIDTRDGAFSSLFTGDISEETERKITDVLDDIVYLKVAHHGSRTSTSGDFLARTVPDISVISVGEGNSYGHPTPETLSRLEKCGTMIYRTDKSGEVILTYDDKRITVNTVLPAGL